MSAMEQTRYRQSPDSNALTFDECRRDLQPAPSTAMLELAPSAPQPTRQRTRMRTSFLAPTAAGAMVISAFAIMVGVCNSDITRALIDKATAFMAGAAGAPSAVQAATNQPAARQRKDDPARVTDPGTRATSNTSVPRSGTASREDMARDGNEAPALRTGNEGAVPPPKTLDAETSAALLTRASSLMALGDIAAARLLLERAANARNATAAFLLARTYDPAVLGVRDTRSVTPDAAMARDWYRKAASFGSADAQERLTQLHN